MDVDTFGWCLIFLGVGITLGSTAVLVWIFKQPPPEDGES